MSYADFKNKSLNHVIGDGQCVALIDGGSQSYVEYLWPNTNTNDYIKPVVGAKDIMGAANPAHFDIIANDHNNPNQVPLQGDIMVFDATPQSGYSNTFNNPYGHTGVCESADSNGYSLLQQNAPSEGASVNVTHYAWKFRPCLGWLRPKLNSTPVPPKPPTPQPTPTQHTIYLPPTTGPWHLYKPGGPYVASQAKGLLYPSKFGGLTYPIDASLGNGIYRITTHDFGQGDIWTNGSTVVVH